MKAPTATHRGFEFRGFSLLGKTYGRLTVTKCLGHPPGQKQTIWECKCSCGRKTAIRGNNLKAGNTRSCGCLKYEPPGHPDKRDFSRAIVLSPQPAKGVSNVDTLRGAARAGGAIIAHEANGSVIGQRSSDGYINATAMCTAVGKLFAGYERSGPTQEFLAELAASLGLNIRASRPKSDMLKRITPDGLIISVSAGPYELRGTWVHPDVAVNLAQWCSPKFAVAVSRWVREWMMGGMQPKAKKLPAAASEPGWIEQRADGISTRKELCSTLRACGITEREPYWTATNAAYRAVTGKDAKELKKALGLKKSASLRDCLDAAALNAVAFAEHLASMKIEEAGARGQEALRVALDILARLGQLVLPAAPEKPKELVDEAVALAAFARMKQILG